MAKQFFYSPGLSECAGCATHIKKTRGVGIIVLNAPGNPRMAYCLCNRCTGHIGCADFVRRVEESVMARARLLGAYGSELHDDAGLEPEMGVAQ